MTVAAGLWAAFGCGPSSPAIDARDCRPVMPRSMAAAVERAAPGFRPWELSHLAPELRAQYRCTVRQAPYAVAGDFDGDGRTDLTVEGRDSRSRVHLAIFAAGKPWRVVEIDRRPLAAEDSTSRHFFTYVAPGEIYAPSNIEPEPLRLTTDAFGIVFWEKGSAVYFWRDSRFVPYVTGD